MTDADQDKLLPCPLVLEARKVWWEIVESDEGECDLMRIVRELADEVERLRRPSDTVREALEPQAVVDVCAQIASEEFQERGWHQYYKQAAASIERSIRAHGIARALVGRETKT